MSWESTEWKISPITWHCTSPVWCLIRQSNLKWVALLVCWTAQDSFVSSERNPAAIWGSVRVSLESFGRYCPRPMSSKPGTCKSMLGRWNRSIDHTPWQSTFIFQISRIPLQYKIGIKPGSLFFHFPLRRSFQNLRSYISWHPVSKNWIHCSFSSKLCMSS